MDAKTSGRVPSGTPRCRRLTDEKRIITWTLRKEGLSLSRIAARIGASKGTVSHELSRSRGRNGCRYKKAQGMARHRVASTEGGCVMSAIVGMLAGLPEDMPKTRWSASTGCSTIGR